MFNFCVLTGPVLTEPKLTFFEGHPDTIFYLGISSGPYKAGVIKVCCGHHLAPVAEDCIHRGDRRAIKLEAADTKTSEPRVIYPER
jgi:hypothetical protein